MKRFLRYLLAAAVPAALLAGPAGLVAESLAADGRNPQEKQLLAVLRSDATEADKAVACKGLAVHGSTDAVPDLAKLLADERLASWARIALEAIPEPACDEALRAAAESLSGRLLVGAINSLSIRRDPAALEILSRRLNDPDPDVASAAAAALGGLPGKQAAERLTKALADGAAAIRPTFAEACVVQAERMLAAGDAAGASAVYDLVRGADVPRQRILEATRGAILARAAAGVPLLVEQLRSPDDDRFATGLSTARELAVPGVDDALAAELPKAAAARAVLLVEAMADRNGPGALPVIVAAATRGPREVRLAALRACGRIGDSSCLDPLLAVAADPDADIAVAARKALGDVRDPVVDEEILRLARSPGPVSRALVFDIVGRRRIDAVPEAVAALDGDDAAVRSAALFALGETIDPGRLPIVVRQAVQPRTDAEAPVAMQALRSACVRMADRDACADLLAEAMGGKPIGLRTGLLDIVGEVGGPKALGVVVAAARDPDSAIQDVATRLLGKWATPDAANDLLALAESLPDGKFRTRAFRGYLRILRQFTFSDDERLDMCRKALVAARDADDRNAVIEAAKPKLKPDVLAELLAEKNPEVSFTKVPLTDRFYAEGAAIGDIDRDGHGDAVYGPHWYAGPDFKTRHEIYPPHEFDPHGYSDNFLTFVADIDGDAWPDVLACGFPGKEASWFRNPGKQGGAWQRHLAFPTVDNESPGFGDITGDGRPKLLFHSEGVLGFAGPGDPTGTQRWPFKGCSTAEKKRQRFTHGLGVGDVNGDGRRDFLMADGWWEQPAPPAGDPWEHHPAAFGSGGAQMHVYDVDGDGDQDVITSLVAHGYGVAWFEQVRRDGGIAFVQHAILPAAAGENLDGVQFSQPHALEVVDIDGDGLKDVVTGKRFWAHGPKGDPDPGGPALLYWFKLVRDGGKTGAAAVRYEPHQIDGDSGVGTQFAVGDLDGDGRVDLVIGNKKGGFVFRRNR